MLADAGIPMLFIQWPLMIGALIPVIIVETLLIRRWVPLSYRQAFVGTTVANLLSTFVGFPLAWLTMLAIEMVIGLSFGAAAANQHWSFINSPFFQILTFPLGIAWLGPLETEDSWLIPVAAALLLIPSFFVSVWLERLICYRFWPNSDRAAVRRGVFRANLASYILLFLLACGWAGFEFYLRRQ